MPEWRAAIRAARNTILACALAFVLGVLSVDPPEPEPAPAPVVTITDRSVRQLARALEQALVAQAEDVLDQVDQGAVTVTPATQPAPEDPPPTWQPSPTTTTTTPAPTTTTAPADSTFRWPTTTVPPPYTVTVP